MAKSPPSGSKKPVVHDDIFGKKTSGPASSNPFAKSANITLSVPETVKIHLVDASALSVYETWSFLASIVWSAFVGFFVAWLQARPGEGIAQSQMEPSAKAAIQSAQATTANAYLVFAAICFVVFVILVYSALSKRHTIRTQTREVEFKVGDPVDK